MIQLRFYKARSMAEWRLLIEQGVGPTAAAGAWWPRGCGLGRLVCSSGKGGRLWGTGAVCGGRRCSKILKGELSLVWIPVYLKFLLDLQREISNRRLDMRVWIQGYHLSWRNNFPNGKPHEASRQVMIPLAPNLHQTHLEACRTRWLACPEFLIQ